MEGRSLEKTPPEAMSSGSLRLLRNALENEFASTVLPGDAEGSGAALSRMDGNGGDHAQDPEMEWPSGIEVAPLILENRAGGKETGFHSNEEAKRNSANTSDAISELLLDRSEQSVMVANSMNDIPSARNITKTVEQNIDRVSQAQSSDLLPASSKSVGSSSSNVGIGGKLTEIPQVVVHKANEEERLKLVEAPEAFEDDAVEEDREPRTVKVILDGDVDRTFFLSACSNVRQVKEVLAQKLKVIPKNIILRASGRKLYEEDALDDVGDINMELSYDECDETPCEVQDRKKSSSKLVQVKVLQPDGTWKYTRVTVVDGGPGRQYLGGYRDKRTGQVYYHVVCQTDARKRSEKSITREVQTNLPAVDCGVNTSRAITTQTSKALSAPGKILSARPYVPYNESRKTMVPHMAARIIQRTWRKFIFRRFIVKHFKKLAASLEDKAKDKSTAVEAVQNRRIQTLTGAIYPSFRNHFTDGLGFFHLWATREARRLASMKEGFARKAAMAELLQQEQKILFVLETQRMKAVKENLQKQDIMFLEGTARSRARVYKKGNVTLIDDLNVQKAGVLKEMFASYSRTDVTTVERLEILNGLRSSLLRELPYHPDASELLEILDREVDLITMGFPNDQMKYLRKRFETRFLHLCHDPEVNPQAKYYRKSHLTRKKYAIRRCKRCNKNLPSSLMFKHVRMKKLNVCMSCAQLEQNVATHQLNLAPFKRMLHALRQRELEKMCRSSIPFLLQPLGTYFLVNVIWDGRSVWSGNSDLTQLRMTRWLPDQDWSVWNMVVLTEPEVVEHERITDPLTHYPEDYILQVRMKNILGRMHFKYLVDIDNDFKFNRTSMSTLPRDHLLYVNSRHAKYAPANDVPGFFKPGLSSTKRKGAMKSVNV